MGSQEVKVPDIGDFDAVEIVEVLVSEGDEVEKEDSLITLESDKATMDVPSPTAGTVNELKVSTGDQVSQGDVILTLESADGDEDDGDEAEEPDDEPEDEDSDDGEDEEDEPEDSEDDESEDDGEKKKKTEPEDENGDDEDREEPEDHDEFKHAHASPAVRRYARELGADLTRIDGSGRKGRITHEDVQKYVKAKLAKAESDGSAPETAQGAALPPMPEIDFSKYGETEQEELSRIRKRSAKNLHRSWLHVPHVTQFDEADATELEAFRQDLKPEAEERGVKMTFLPFLMKAVVAALKEFPTVNSSLAPDGESLILKKYYHLGIAVDTDNGLVVPVVRDVDQKGLFDLAAEVADVADRARNRKLKPEDLQGASFTITSLGGIGGTAFTPIVNAPEVGILGVSRMETKPVWQDGEFVPRKMLPLSFSYDHRVVDGALAARFTVYLSKVLSDLRRSLL